MTADVCNVAVDTCDLPVFCTCGCSHCCVRRDIQETIPSRRELKEARPLVHKHRLLIQPTLSGEHTETQHYAVTEEVGAKNPSQKGNDKVNVPEKKPPLNNHGFQCDACKTVFTRKYSLTVHLRRRTCQQNLKSNHKSTSSVPNHIQKIQQGIPDQVKQLDVFTSSPIPQKTCRKPVHSQNTLTVHNSVHPVDQSYICNICQRHFATRAALRNHTTTHKGVKSFHCVLCGADFVKKDSLRIHLRKHTGERPFRCDMCPAAFYRRFTLKNHRVLHTGEHPHVCAVCGKAFSTKCALTAHERTSHSRRESWRYATRRTRDFQRAVCEHCGKVFSSAANLRIHQRSHSGARPFACLACGAAFAKKYSLQCHVRRHTGERPFRCSECSAAFFRQSTLTTHRRRHTGERPHLCKICGRGFIQSASLVYHLKHHDHVGTTSQESSLAQRSQMESVT